MAWKYLLSPTFQVVNTAGKPATGGYIEVYIHGTRDRYYCASDFDGTLHPFKIPLDSLGANIVLADDSQTYDVYVYNRYGSLIMSRYDVPTVRGKDSAFSGDVSDATCSFTKDAGDTSDMSSGSMLKVIFTKISKFFASLKRVAFTGSYNDLSDKPSIPAAQVNSDWNANSGVSEILNKPDLSQYIPSSQKGAANGVGTLGSDKVQPYSELYKGYVVSGDAIFKLCRIPKNTTYSGGVSFIFTSRAYNKASGQVLLWISPCEYQESNVTYKVVNLFSRANDVSMLFYYKDVTVDSNSYVDVYFRVYGSSSTHVMPMWMRNGVEDMLSTSSVSLPEGAVEMTNRFFNVCAAKGGVGSASTPIYVNNAGNAVACTPQVFVAMYNETSYSDVEAAYFNNEQVVFCKDENNRLYQLKGRYSGTFVFESTVDKGGGTFITIMLNSSNVWTSEIHSVKEYCVYRKSYNALHPLSTAPTATDISNGYMDVEFDLGNAEGFVIGDGNTLVFVGIPNRGGPSGVYFADAFTKIELYVINDNNNPFLAAKVKDTSKDDYGDTLGSNDLYMWNRTYSGTRTSTFIVKKFRARYYLNMNTAWVPNLATNFYIYFTILL